MTNIQSVSDVPSGDVVGLAERMRLSDIESDYDSGVSFYLPEDVLPDDVRYALIDALFDFIEGNVQEGNDNA